MDAAEEGDGYECRDEDVSDFRFEAADLFGFGARPDWAIERYPVPSARTARTASAV